MSRAYISPSTQEKNLTALGDTEENIMHKIADELVPLLKDSGIEIFRGKKDQSLAQMVYESNNLAVDCHVAIHSNAYNEKARGCEVFHYPNSVKGEKLADAIYKYMEPLTPTADRKVQVNSTYYELKNTKAPAVIVEVDFHDSYEGATWINQNIYPIAEAIAEGICEYLGVPLRKNPYRKAIMDIKRIVESL
jgi:N-acetylmuramoyl-L-alanine amidase